MAMPLRRAPPWPADTVTPAAALPPSPARAPVPLCLVLANDPDAVAGALPQLRGFAARHGLSARLANRVEVVFEELVSNVIRHGFTPGSAQSAMVELLRLEDGVRLVMEDDGPAFDPVARPLPPPLTDLGSAPEGGLGIALVARLARRFAREMPPQQPGMINRTVVELAG